jgi:hypothetical protein
MTFVINILHYKLINNSKTKKTTSLVPLYNPCICKYLPYMNYSHNISKYQTFLVAPFDTEIRKNMAIKNETTTFCIFGNIKQLICCSFARNSLEL